MQEAARIFNSGSLKLEGVLHLPRLEGRPLPGVALCHPHPLYGGNMANNVIIAVSRALSELGIIALRFNFRGVGLSEGTYDHGKGEQDDLRAALDFLGECPELESGRLGLMGYSFGGMMALEVAKSDVPARALACVSPVVKPGLIDGLNKPAYFICGSDDQVTPVENLFREAKNNNRSGQVEIVPGVDHFWNGQEKKMAGKVAAFFKRSL